MTPLRSIPFEVRIIGLDMRQIVGQLLRLLLLVELVRLVWNGVERLRIDMRNSTRTPQTSTVVEQGLKAIKVLNKVLSDILPSLYEIDYYGPHS
ncbi:hypothetical protein GGI08_008587 [Coemansia sp. S2]|nr:hypothetical protein H4S03_004258 [Coemansia sp. S3946]KAJ2036636.1 hypothetical protein GGI08_008587 [Coemansia sp. S2]KAJ2074421.1 hypothetical protein GGH13_001338 [Coemansia sp. S155-1]KAJ2348891.1 hypothetical protein GGH92_002693 [Coemansia sp. RSA 2673]KAJ2431920.1 hypothetical protein GGF41_000316 [Coemansia sp. RSA 2531]